MTDFAPEQFVPAQIVTRLFQRMRKRFNLGMQEYLAALDAVNGGWGQNNLDELKIALKLLWCHSLAEQNQFVLIWEAAIADLSQTQPDPIAEPVTAAPPRRHQPEPPPSRPAPLPEELPQPVNAALSPLPLRAPFTPAEIDEVPEFQTYCPVTRRFMSYAWRYLRRPVAAGPRTVLDVRATVEQVARQGFFLAPVYCRQQINQARLLLFVDQEGSMTPFHHFSRDLVETAESDSTLETVDAYYFHNVPAASVYQDAHLTVPVSLERSLAECDRDTSILIISDAGAARGYRRLERIQATTEFLAHLKQYTNLIGWLNPMPTERWVSSSAEVIAYLVSMTQMDKDGLSNAIEVVRGQPLFSTDSEQL